MHTSPFVRTPGLRQFRLVVNGLRQFFLCVYCADGSICEYGPFDSGEEALAVQAELESPTIYNYED